MADAEALRQIFSVPTAAWTGVALLALFIWRMWNGSPAMFQQWIEYRKAKAAEKAADWKRLRDEISRGDERYARLEGRADKLEEAEQQCREDLASAKERIATLEGLNMGRGMARQEAAIIESAKRITDEKDKP